MIQGYVLGFLFDEWNSVALIEKNRPDWQAGKINGIGGKIEDGEDPIEAMAREFKEEAGLYVSNWENFALLESPRSKIYVFRAWTDSDILHSVKSMEDEQVVVHNTYAQLVPKNAVPNLHWLLPLAINREERFVKANYA
jgi:8-oxo-dGTP diphosphatase